MTRPVATDVRIDNDSKQLVIHLSNDGEFRYPLRHLPKLGAASLDQQRNIRIWGGGQFLRWESVDEDISVPQLLAGVCSWAEIDGESVYEATNIDESIH